MEPPKMGRPKIVWPEAEQLLVDDEGYREYEEENWKVSKAQERLQQLLPQRSPEQIRRKLDTLRRELRVDVMTHRIRMRQLNGIDGGGVARQKPDVRPAKKI